MGKQLAFVLSGGGSRGALQAGALQALLEAGYQPDLITGTSIGAANGVFLAIHGFTPGGVQKLEQVWRATVNQDWMPTNMWWQTMRLLFRRAPGGSQRIREFALAQGVTPDLRFADLADIRLYLVASDLNSACPVVYGLDPNESVLEGMLASTALPPWMAPVKKEGRYLVDGGAVSNLPIETAMRQGATDIIALDLADPSDLALYARGWSSMIWKLDKTIEYRQFTLEMELAKARGILVRHVPLVCEEPVPIWDFRHSVELIERGYQITQQAIAAWQSEEQPAG